MAIGALTTTVLPDANVLYSRTLRDWLALCYLEVGGWFEVVWTEDIVAEVIYRLRRDNPTASDRQIGGVRDKLVEVFSNGRIVGYAIDSDVSYHLQGIGWPADLEMRQCCWRQDAPKQLQSAQVIIGCAAEDRPAGEGGPDGITLIYKSTCVPWEGGWLMGSVDELSGDDKLSVDLARSENHLIRELIAARRRRGLKPAELARKMGVDRSAVTRFESGGTNPTMATINRYAEAVGAMIRYTVEPGAVPPVSPSTPSVSHSTPRKWSADESSAGPDEAKPETVDG